ncbi:MAG: radical SAM protein [Lachnospiraceae bacterium]|nr:radical SAM protein [Lachnospiraceae bacterium]
MKWHHKEHEYDEYWHKIENIKSVYLYGAGLVGKSVLHVLDGYLDILGFIDSDHSKIHTYIEGIYVYSLSEVHLDDTSTILITVSPDNVEDVIKHTSEYNFRSEDMHVFLPVMFNYRYNKLLLTSVSYLPTTVCNLKCRYCLNFSPYLKHKEFRDIDKLKHDIDVFFSQIDNVLLFHVSGGEPFLYPQIDELLHYISDNYVDRIERLETTTNGTVLPGDKLCNTLSELNVGVTLDDYREAVPQFNETFDKIIAKFDHYNLNYRIQKVDKWIDLRSSNNVNLSEHYLKNHFDRCNVPWQEYRNGFLYLCNYSDYAAVADLYTVHDDERLNISNASKKEIMEFRLGYSDKGYVDFCRHCAGYYNNNNYVTPAEQC